MLYYFRRYYSSPTPHSLPVPVLRQAFQRKPPPRLGFFLEGANLAGDGLQLEQSPLNGRELLFGEVDVDDSGDHGQCHGQRGVPETITAVNNTVPFGPTRNSGWLSKGVV